MRSSLLAKAGRPLLMGMIHVRAMPGTPKYGGHLAPILEAALQEAHLLQQCGLDGLVIENMHDVPYLTRVGPEVLTVMTRVCAEVRQAFPPHKPVGVQVLAGANQGALAVALAAGLDFIRAEAFVFAHVADEGWMDGQAGQLLR